MCVGVSRRDQSGGYLDEGGIALCQMMSEREPCILTLTNFLLRSQVQNYPDNKDGICHEVPQPSLPQVLVQVRRAKGGSTGDPLGSDTADLFKLQRAYKFPGHFVKCRCRFSRSGVGPKVLHFFFLN